MNLTIRIIIYTIIVILILHIILKHITVQENFINTIKNSKISNELVLSENNIDKEDMKENMKEDMKEDLLSFINENKEIYNSENDNYSDLSNFFEKKTVAIPEPEIQLTTKNPINIVNKNSNQWEYSNENIMNGGEITNGLFGFDDGNSLWAQCNIK